MSLIVFILLLKNEENIKGLFWKVILQIINEPIENWNAIGKYWLSRLDFKFNETFFICKCSNVSSLNLNRYPLFYQKSIQAWTKFLQITIDELF
jgi:hypothetical protein